MRLEVEHRELWNRFRSCERNEMIITKNGRCLFPLLKFKIFEEEYDVMKPGDKDLFSYALSMERVDYYKWKFRHNHWFCLPSSTSSAASASASTSASSRPQNLNLIQETSHLFESESSPKSWNYLKNEGINFAKVKLTNRKGTSSSAQMSLLNLNFKTSSSSTATTTSTFRTSHSPKESCQENYFSLSSFGNYVPVVHLVDWELFLSLHGVDNNVGPIPLKRLFELYPIKLLEQEGSLKRFKMEECAFIAVTHYQNELITHLKKHNNPHAKGFILTNEGIGKIINSVPRGRPGRKKRNITIDTSLSDFSTNSMDMDTPDATTNISTLSEEVILAGLALEKMSEGNHHVPRSEHQIFLAEAVREYENDQIMNLHRNITQDKSNNNNNNMLLEYYNKN